MEREIVFHFGLVLYLTSWQNFFSHIFEKQKTFLLLLKIIIYEWLDCHSAWMNQMKHCKCQFLLLKVKTQKYLKFNIKKIDDSHLMT